MLHQHNIMAQPYRPDLGPGFWPEYQPPATRVGAAVQFPADERFAERMITAYAQDAAQSRKDRRK